MKLRNLIGRAGSGKTYTCLEEIKQLVALQPLGPPIIYLVPEQMTFQSEQELTRHLGTGGLIRTQVFSFTRLAWRILQETGGMTRHHMDDVGIHMLLRKIISTHQQDLKVFGKASEQKGFYEQMSTMLKELKNYTITPDDLAEVRSAMLGAKQITLDKLTDLQMIFTAFEQALLGHYVSSEDYLKLLAEKIASSTYLKNAIIYIDGFYTLSPQEILVLGELMKHCQMVTMTHTMDQTNNPMFAPMKLKEQMSKLAEELGGAEENIFVQSDMGRFHNSPSLVHLEKYYDTRPTKSYHGESDIQFMTAVNRRAEVEGIAREVRKIVREKGVRYRDIVLLLRNGEAYNDFIRTIFTDYDIPFFLADKRPMHYHPFIEFIRTSLEAVKDYYRYDSVFRCIKTEFLFPLDAPDTLREDMHTLENYCLAYGIQGGKWHRPFTYSKYRTLDRVRKVKTDEELKMEEKLNGLRLLISNPLKKLEEEIKLAKTGADFAHALYTYIESVQAFEKLDKLREEAQDVLEAKDHEMVWDGVIGLLDQYVEILGEEETNLTGFLEVLEVGLDTLTFANIPPTLDGVLIGHADQSRLSRPKYVFLMGVNEGVIPKSLEETGMMDEEERGLLSQYGVQLAPTATEQLMDESFQIYHMLTRASHQLYICHSIANEEGATLMPSYMIKRLQDMFPTATTHFITNDVNDVGGEREFSFISSIEPTLSFLTQKLQAWKKYPQTTNMDIWWDVYNYYIQHDLLREKNKRVISSLFYENVGRPLPKQISKQLYGTKIESSVSRMESFNRCAYQHFANYGLKLRPRDIYKLEAPDIGTMFHGALKYMTDALEAKNQSWSDVSQAELIALAKSAVETIAPGVQREILLSSSRLRYMKGKLQKVVEKTALILQAHAQSSGFAPIAMEQAFGRKSPLPALHFDLPNGVAMELVGRIDRIDRGGNFLRIIDFKSSDRKLDLKEVYYGIALQMLAYLDVVISGATSWLGVEATPAGVLYFHVHNPLLQVGGPMDEADIEAQVRKKYRMRGLVLADMELAELMDTSLIPGKNSDILSIGLKKDGHFTANSAVASIEDFAILTNYVRKSLVDAGVAMTDGAIHIAPYKMKSQTPCTFCPYQSVCQFDPTLADNHYRVLGDMKTGEVFERMRGELDGDHT